MYLFLLWFSHQVVSNSLWPHGLQCTRPPYPSPSLGICPGSCHWIGYIIQPSHLFCFFNSYFYFILLYITVLVLPYIDMNPPQVYMHSQTWTPLPPPSLYHLSGSSQCTSPKHPVSCIGHRLVIRFFMIVYMFQCHSPKSSHPLPLSPKVCSAHLYLFCCLAYRVIITIFLNSIYMC